MDENRWMEAEKPAWFALYTQVNHEKEVAKRLEDRSIESFAPLMEGWSKRRDRRKRILVPLFPGYIFLHALLNPDTHLRVLKTPGALKILGDSQGPLTVNDSEITNLKGLLASRQPLSRQAYLKEGDWVRVVRGPLTGCLGILVRHHLNKGRLVINVNLIRQSVSAELDVEDVEPMAVTAEGQCRGWQVSEHTPQYPPSRMVS